MLTIHNIASRRDFEVHILADGPAWTLPNFPWDSAPLKVMAEVCHDDENLYVCLRAYEPNPRITVYEAEGSVHLDSCMEFFFSPCPALRPHYFNLEANAAGTDKFDYGPGRHGRIQAPGFHGTEDMKAEVTAEYWQLLCTIPYAAIRLEAPEFTGTSGSILRGNIYRCGEKAAVQSFVTLFPIGTASPDYHRPEFFGKLLLE